MKEYQIWKCSGKRFEKLEKLVAVFYDVELAKEFINTEHKGFNTEYAIKNDGEIIYSNFLMSCR